MMEDRQYEQQALEALRKAVANALDCKRRLGRYAVVWRDGQTVRLAPEQLGSVGQYAPAASASPSTVREPGPDGDGDDEGPK